MTKDMVPTEPIIFLDIDGVLNHSEYGEDTYWDHFAEKDIPIDRDNLDNFEKVLIAIPNVKIVWSTDWRLYNEPLWNNRWKNPRLYLESLPLFKGKIIGKTPKKMSSEHHHEIWFWMREFNSDGHITRWAAVDDLSLWGNRFDGHRVNTDPNIGFSLENANQLIKILKI